MNPCKYLERCLPCSNYSINVTTVTAVIIVVVAMSYHGEISWVLLCKIMFLDTKGSDKESHFLLFALNLTVTGFNAQSCLLGILKQ